MSLSIPVLYGSMRSDRQGIKAARFFVRQLAERGHRPELVDALDLDLPLLDRMYKEYPAGEAPAALEGLAGLYRQADAFLVISGEYNHGIPPALKNLIDHFLEEYFHRPSAIVCYSAGRFGGVRAAMQLRMTLAEIGTVSIPSLYPIAAVQDAFAEDGTPRDASEAGRAERFLAELEWYARALAAARAAGTPA